MTYLPVPQAGSGGSGPVIAVTDETNAGFGADNLPNSPNVNGIGSTETAIAAMDVEGAQQGVKAISNVASIVASWPGAVAANFAVFNFDPENSK